MNSEVTLLPCPFCGHDQPEVERLGTRRESCIIACGNCGARHESSDMGEFNGQAWNRRTTPPASGEVVGVPSQQIVDWIGYDAAMKYISAAPKQAMGWLPSSNDGKEQEAFETWAKGRRYDMETHPLHWLFLNERTYAARDGWRAALDYVNGKLPSPPEKAGG